MVLDKIEKAAIAVLIMCVMCLTYIGICIIILERKVVMNYEILTMKDYRDAINILENSYNDNNSIKTNEEYREFISDDLDIGLYFYSEKKMGAYAGKTYALIRLIVIDEDIAGYSYCRTFAHEAFHLKEFIGQEDYVCFKTFKYLYESEELHNVGVSYGLNQIYGLYTGEYDVSQHIVSYLTKK